MQKHDVITLVGQPKQMTVRERVEEVRWITTERVWDVEVCQFHQPPLEDVHQPSEVLVMHVVGQII